jgi:fumarate reductase subunit C
MSTQVSKRKPYQQKMAPNWWLKNQAYRYYMLRSATCLFVMLYALVLLWGLYALTSGEIAFNAWLTAQQSPLFIIFHIVTLIAMLYHSKTWFMLAPKTIRIQLGKTIVADKAIEGAMWLSWLICSIVILVLLLF